MGQRRQFAALLGLCLCTVSQAAQSPVGSAWHPYLSLASSQTPEEEPGQLDLSPHLASAAPSLRRNSWLVDDSQWTSFNDSELVPVLPQAIVWLMEVVEQRFHNKSKLPDQLDRAVTLARYTSVVYCNPENVRAWNCTRCNGRAEAMQPYGTIYDPVWDLRSYVGFSPSLNGIVVAFRGTDSHSIYNWVENMRYWRTDYSVPFPGAKGAYVHTGFFMSYNASNLRPNVTDAVGSLLTFHPGVPIYVVGHSMGAAVATLCALDLLFTFQLQPADVRLYTYGSPRVGNAEFAQYVARTLPESIRVTHNRDLVPNWPPQWVGFHHVATEVWVIDVSLVHVLGVCDSSGEDPACHNSVCLFGLCTSVNDHLHYMGADMFHSSASGMEVC